MSVRKGGGQDLGKGGDVRGDDLSYSGILRITVESLELIIEQFTPDAVASFAAVIFVAIPPVPSKDPESEVSACNFLKSSTTAIRFAFGFVKGLALVGLTL